MTYKNSARIFHCLKADLNENQILKTLRQQKIKESGQEYEETQVTEVPRLYYENNEVKKHTLQLAFSTLKCKMNLIVVITVLARKEVIFFIHVLHL